MAKKGARASGGGGANRSNKDKAMAAELKKQGITRTTQRCPICNKTISLNQFYKHIRVHH